MEIAHGKTVVYCENIIEKIAEMADKSRDFRHDARTKNIELEYKLDQIKTSLENHNLLRQKEAMELSKEQVRVDTRWSILGKPISLLVIGGIVTTLLKALIDLLKK